MNIASKAAYFFRYVAFKPSRLLNLIIVRISKALRFPRVLGMPITLMLEPTDICNLKCPLCPTGAGLLGRKKAIMKFDDFKGIIDELGPYIIHLRLWNWGEPLINKEIYKMIEYAKKFDIFVNTSTNSFFLTEENASKLVKSGLDELIVSLDGASEETYKRYRKQGSFSKAISAMKKLVLEKRRLRSKTPIIKMQFIVMRHNEHEVEKAINLARSIGVDEIFFKTVGMMDTSVYEPIEQYLPLNPKFRRYNLKEGKAKARQVTNFCEYLWDETTINVDGSVVPCCRDSHNSYVFGNIFREKFRDIWNNEKYVSFRKQVLKDKQKIGLCENCPGNKKEFKIMEIRF
jgi:radical SAM protein with 4Fe4S-binding SPASM domain